MFIYPVFSSGSEGTTSSGGKLSFINCALQLFSAESPMLVCSKKKLAGGWTNHLKNMLAKLDHFSQDRGGSKFSKMFEGPPPRKSLNYMRNYIFDHILRRLVWESYLKFHKFSTNKNTLNQRIPSNLVQVGPKKIIRWTSHDMSITSSQSKSALR